MQFYFLKIIHDGICGLTAGPEAAASASLCALSGGALAVTALALKKMEHERGEGGDVTRDAAAKLGADDTAGFQEMRQHRENSVSVTAADVLLKRRAKASSHRLWTREDGFTMSVPRRV